MSDHPPLSRSYLNSKNVQPMDHASDSEDSASASASQPQLAGPGSDTTAKPHSNKILSKLDPRLDSDILEETEQDTAQQEGGERRGSHFLRLY
ncbi:hypothetical protein BO70DRAFT_361171 [Aspergillus heteromorphus CBS 117.55]|uniref:Uncharacterized protein n=1 Tax=Aspergillus heteromorphus CBS 117.55 TaxID=1448321 RepID=A0A317WKN8_9EURO|nr:uncharacterized protein BO70DRAFT_361171 [Aspergillus heteromorphus CBS 117.55]PWY84770.1 hypothetical protein BO70DRAFT_361171 [Aspergillus heteromorphus CBS 117.55]